MTTGRRTLVAQATTAVLVAAIGYVFRVLKPKIVP